MAIFTYFFILLLSNFDFAYTNNNNIVGCGGFVKSDIIGFSFKKLSANLIFPDGTMIYVTEILPNGAYSIPVYDYGEYILKIISPKGWNIEPREGYRLLVNNQYSCSENYNFKFTGFSIYGKISTANIDQGPSGIVIDLIKDNKIVTIATTIEGGEFIIDNVLPGKYYLNLNSKTTEGKTIELVDNKYDIEIINDNVIIEDSFIIHGYPVFGDVYFHDESVLGVEFFLFSKSLNSDTFNFTKYNCVKFNKSFNEIKGYIPLCKAISNNNGEFLFPLLPGGEYLIFPVYEFNDSKFTFEPSKHEFQITSHSIDLRSHFKISGFSVRGRVIVIGSDIGMPNAEIRVDDKFISKTSENGDFIINCVNKGSHQLTVIVNGYLFNKTLVQFDPQNSNIGNFYPEKISICGTIVIDTNRISQNVMKELSIPRKFILINENTGIAVDQVYTTSDAKEDKEGFEAKSNNFISRFCFYAKPGFYIVKPISDATVTISLAPNQIKVQLNSIPITVKFSQFRGTISGYIKCIERCNTGEFEVSLKSTDDNNESYFIQHILISELKPNEGAFTFKDIVPGTYQIELISANGHSLEYKNRWCWSQNILPITMIDENIKAGLLFEQTGFLLEINSSHNMNVDYFHLNNKERILTGSKSLNNGVSEICLPNSGKFEMKIYSCHKLINDTIIIDTNVGFNNKIKLDVVQYKVNIDFVLTNSLKKITDQNELELDVKGLITYNLNTDPIVKSINWKNSVGKLEFWVEPETSIEVSSISNKFLVKPYKINFLLPHGTTECVSEMGKFELEPGTFIVGTISPPLKDVLIEVRKVSLSIEEDIVESIVLTSNSNEDGQFNIGPLPSSFKYDIKLIKSGYTFLKIDNDNAIYLFKSLKLSELRVSIIDHITKKPISGILLSIIGDEIRKNELTDESGMFSFVGLTAGTYYLRPMMKELEFNPPGAIEITMTEGHLESINIEAFQTSFSVYGKVVSLNGEPESGMTVTADPIRNIKNDICQINALRNEHATSDENGTFRIRGLIPKCSYKLSLKIVENTEDGGIFRSHPRNIVIKMTNEDVLNVKLYAIRNMNLREISAMVRTNNEVYLNSLQISVFPTDNPDNVLSIHKFLSDSVYFQMTLPQINKKVEYAIRLQSNLNPRLYLNISAKEETFVIEAGMKTFVKHFEFEFYPKKHTFGDNDISLSISSSIMFPLLLVIIGILYSKKESLWPILSNVFTVSMKWIGQYFVSNRKTLTYTTSSSSNTLDAAEISELNSVIAKPKSNIIPISIKKPPFWLRPKKA